MNCGKPAARFTDLISFGGVAGVLVDPDPKVGKVGSIVGKAYDAEFIPSPIFVVGLKIDIPASRFRVSIPDDIPRSEGVRGGIDGSDDEDVEDRGEVACKKDAIVGWEELIKESSALLGWMTDLESSVPVPLIKKFQGSYGKARTRL